MYIEEGKLRCAFDVVIDTMMLNMCEMKRRMEMGMNK
jgi:hypothetical protein